jgi:hypothetical protein
MNSLVLFKELRLTSFPSSSRTVIGPTAYQRSLPSIPCTFCTPHPFPVSSTHPGLHPRQRRHRRSKRQIIMTKNYTTTSSLFIITDNNCNHISRSDNLDQS